MLKFEPDVEHEDIHTQIFDAMNNLPNGIIPSLPSVFHFEGGDESRLFLFYHPSKLADCIYSNLQVLQDRGWNALMTVTDDGFVHVFFGMNDKELVMPEVFSMPVAGSC
jgi:hypothetical protein